MDAKEVLKLIDAGFTAEEIRALTAPSEDKKPDQKQEPPKAPEKQVHTKAPEQKQEQNAPDKSAEGNKSDKSDKILEAIDKLTGSITTFMITSTGRAGNDEQASIDDVLAKILFPDGEEEN